MTGLYFYGARYYDSRASIWLGVDPLAEKYAGISAFAYCANNPIMFIDPDGMKIDWSNVTKKEKRFIKSTLRQYSGSRTCRDLMKVLKKSDYKYIISNEPIKPTSFGEFSGGYDLEIEMESEIDGEEPDIFILPINSEQNGGTIAFDFGLKKKEFNEIYGNTVIEEFIHANQYDQYVHKDGRINGVRANADDEFEAKVIVGMILQEAKINLPIKSFDILPTVYGKTVNNNFSIEQYNNAKNVWINDPLTSKGYKFNIVRDSSPDLLLKYLNDK